MKGANIDKLSALSKDISQAFSNVSTCKKEELEEEIKSLKEPIDDFKLMIGAAEEACLRRRKLVYKFFELRDIVAKNSTQIGSMDFEISSHMRQQHANMTLKLEEM